MGNKTSKAQRTSSVEAYKWEVSALREKLADAYIELSGKEVHSSICGTSCAPAATPTKCDCEVQVTSAMDSTRDVKIPKETTFGCGHTNQGSCSRCLGRVTNERNDLQAELAQCRFDVQQYKDAMEELKKEIKWWNAHYSDLQKELLITKVSLSEQGEELKDWKLVAIADNKRCLNLEERLAKAEAVVEAARAMQRSPTWEVTAIEAERICAELGSYDAALAPRDSQIKENS